MVCESVFLTVVNWNTSTLAKYFKVSEDAIYFLSCLPEDFSRAKASWQNFDVVAYVRPWGTIVNFHQCYTFPTWVGGERVIDRLFVNGFFPLSSIGTLGICCSMSSFNFVWRLSCVFPQVEQLSWPITRWCTQIVLITYIFVIGSGSNSSSRIIIIIVTEYSRINL